MVNTRIIFFTKYTFAGASSRYRVFQYLPYFETENISFTVAPLFGEEYINLLNKGKISLRFIFFSYLNRFLKLFTLPRYNIIYIEYELFPYLPPFFEYFLKFLGFKIVSDYDDAIFHNYDANKFWLIRFFLTNKIKSVMRLSNMVICGNPYLFNYAKFVNDKSFEIPTCIEFKKYSITKISNKNDKFIIGWIGSKTTSKNVLLIAKALKNFSLEYFCEIRLIGFDEALLPKLGLSNVKSIKWNSEDEVTNIEKFTVGIMPLEDKLFEKGKCGFKLIQYMACGIPTISTPFEANVKINRNNNNLFAITEIDWFNCLKTVYENRDFYRRVGELNKQIVKKHYSVENNYTYYLNIFNNLS